MLRHEKQNQHVDSIIVGKGQCILYFNFNRPKEGFKVALTLKERSKRFKADKNTVVDVSSRPKPSILLQRKRASTTQT